MGSGRYHKIRWNLGWASSALPSMTIMGLGNRCSGATISAAASVIDWASGPPVPSAS